jgi:hypothetical protein
MRAMVGIGVTAFVAASLWACEKSAGPGPMGPTPAPSKFVTAIHVSGPATLAPGMAGHYSATATYSDGSTADISTTADWSSGNSHILSVSSSGMAIGLKAGETEVWAWHSYRRGLANVLVLPLSRIASPAWISALTIQSSSSIPRRDVPNPTGSS